MRILHNGKAILIKDEQINLDDFPNLKVIGCPMTGLDHLPLKEIEKRGIKVISLGTIGNRDSETEAFLASITSTAEHTIGLILALARNYKTALNAPYKDRDAYKGHRLNGKTLGIIGLGRVGRQVAHIATALGLKIVFWEPYMATSFLDDLVAQSDIVSLHIPLSGNEGFFTNKMFQQMKPTAYLINTSRDKVIQRGALRWALINKIIAGAAVDFIDDRSLIEYAGARDNLILTNHIGGVTYEDHQKTEEFIINQINNYLKV